MHSQGIRNVGKFLIKKKWFDDFPMVKQVVERKHSFTYFLLKWFKRPQKIILNQQVIWQHVWGIPPILNPANSICLTFRVGKGLHLTRGANREPPQLDKHSNVNLQLLRLTTFHERLIGGKDSSEFHRVMIAETPDSSDFITEFSLHNFNWRIQKNKLQPLK